MFLTESSAAPRINPNLRFNYGCLAKQKRDSTACRGEGTVIVEELVSGFVYLCEVYVCVNILGLGPVGELYMRAYNMVLVLAFTVLSQGQKAL